MKLKDLLLSIMITISIIALLFVATIGIEGIRMAGQAFILFIFKMLLKADV
ncbi:MAG: hypothetical protein RR557_07420 [Bacilli bacterium]